MKTVKRIICAALCSVFMFCVAFPSFALGGTHTYTHTVTNLGVQVSCFSKLTVRKATGKIQLSFVNNLPHLLESDYECFVELYLEYSEGGLSFAQESNYGMSAEGNITIPLGKTVSYNRFSYYLNDDFGYDYTFLTGTLM